MTKRQPAWSAIRDQNCIARATKDTASDCLAVQWMTFCVEWKYQKYCRVRIFLSVSLSEGALSIQIIKVNIFSEDSKMIIDGDPVDTRYRSRYL